MGERTQRMKNQPLKSVYRVVESNADRSKSKLCRTGSLYMRRFLRYCGITLEFIKLSVIVLHTVSCSKKISTFGKAEMIK